MYLLVGTLFVVLALLDVAASPGEPFEIDSRKTIYGGNPFNDVRAAGSAVEISVLWPRAWTVMRLRVPDWWPRMGITRMPTATVASLVIS